MNCDPGRNHRLASSGKHPTERNWRREAFTLIELLVVIAIVATLIGLLLPAVQRVREAAASARCRSNLKQLALAAHSYHDANYLFPVGVAQPGPDGNYDSTFVELLPYLEQATIFEKWNMANPSANFGGTNSLAATPLSMLVCPSAALDVNPIVFGSAAYGVTTYGMNGGTKSFPPTRATNDGVFCYSDDKTWRRVRLEDIADGTSSTFLFGERLMSDGNFDSYQDAPLTPDPVPPFVAFSASTGWAVQPGPNAGAGFLLAGSTTIDFSYPTRYTPPPIPPPPAIPPPPPPVDWNAMSGMVWDRLSAYGSKHSSGANFAFADGSVRFLSIQTPAGILVELSTRSGGETIPFDY